MSEAARPQRGRTCAVILGAVALLAHVGTSCAQTSLQVADTGAVVAVCTLQDERLTEVSGVVASRRNPGCYYVHNDSGDRPQVYVVDRNGRTRLTIRLKNATAVDYEDIALAPGKEPGTFDVCAADIGDNLERRRNATIYRFPEPEVPGDQGTTIDVEPAAYRVRYAEGPANAEAFFVHPRNGDGYILTKRNDARSLVYKLAAPWNAKEETVLPKVATLELPPTVSLARIVTAADISPDGRRLAVRCYVDGWEWRLPAGTDDRDFERIFQRPPAQLTLPVEPQGEALCYSPDGKLLLTISEGKSPVLYEVAAPAP